MLVYPTDHVKSDFIKMEVFLKMFCGSFCFLLVSLRECNCLPNLCPESAVCQCKRQVNMINIDCQGIQSLSDVQILLEHHFQNTSINHLFLQRCSIASIPSLAFQNATIRTIFLICPLTHVSDEAFEGVRGVEQIKLMNTRYIQVPKGIGFPTEVQGLWLEDGALHSLENQLQNLTNLLFLSASHNQITNISKDAFMTLVNLQRLDLSYNKLTRLDPSVFDSLNNLQYISLRENHLESADGLLKNLNPVVIDFQGNNLTSVDNVFHQGMWRVSQLYMGANPLGDFSPEAFMGCLSLLKRLDMQNINLTNPNPKLFQSLPSLVELDLRNNKMPNLSQDIFDNLLGLEVLRLDYDHIVSVDGLFKTVPNLKELRLSYNNIRMLNSTFQFVKKLQILFLSNNKITSILKDDFSSLGSLQQLDLSYNWIEVLASESFLSLSSLQILSLTANSIPSINGSLKYLPSLTAVYLSNNKISFINNSELVGLPNLQNFSLYENQIGSLDGAFVSLPKLSRILLARNQLTTLSEDTFYNVKNLQSTSLNEGNPWICDCRLLWMHNWLVNTQSIQHDEPLCHEPLRFRSIPFLNLTADELVQWPDGCPDVCQCDCTPQGRSFYVSVDCSYKGLHIIPQILPDHLGDLNMQGNFLKNFIDSSNESTSNLIILNLEDNFIQTFPTFLSKELKVLRLSGNNLTRFSHTAVGNLSLEKVTLSRNPWICDCETIDFKRWLLSENDVVSDVNTTLCGPEQKNSALSNKVIVYLTDTELCPPKLSLYISAGVGILSALLVVTSLGLAYTRNKMRIKVWMYAHGFTFVKEEDLDKDKDYDAFVSYSSLDADFFALFTEELKTRQPQMLLCSDENFIYGTLIINNITNAVKSSKRTIMILSENFLKSEWCKTEFRAAHQQALDDKVHRLIIVRYGNLPANSEVDPALQEYLDTTTYLKWGEKYFWDKLLYALPKKKKKTEKDVVSINASERTPLLEP